MVRSHAITILLLVLHIPFLVALRSIKLNDGERHCATVWQHEWSGAAMMIPDANHENIRYIKHNGNWNNGWDNTVSAMYIMPGCWTDTYCGGHYDYKMMRKQGPYNTRFVRSWNDCLTGVRCWSCPDCPAGKYNDWYGCTSCPAGSYSDHKNAISCPTCPNNQISSSGSSSCSNCPSGQGSRNRQYCENCEPGKYSSNNQCEDCQLGYYNGSYRRSSCTACPAGTISRSHRQSCKSCTSGYKSYLSQDKTQNTCEICPAGKKSRNPISDRCDNCGAGKYNPYSGKSSCYDCPAGQYTDSTGRTSCRTCPSGKYAAGVGNTQCSECTECKGGTYIANECHTEDYRCEPLFTVYTPYGRWEKLKACNGHTEIEWSTEIAVLEENGNELASGQEFNEALRQAISRWKDSSRSYATYEETSNCFSFATTVGAEGKVLSAEVTTGFETCAVQGTEWSSSSGEGTESTFEEESSYGYYESFGTYASNVLESRESITTTHHFPECGDVGGGVIYKWKVQALFDSSASTKFSRGVEIDTGVLLAKSGRDKIKKPNCLPGTCLDRHCVECIHGAPPFDEKYTRSVEAQDFLFTPIISDCFDDDQLESDNCLVDANRGTIFPGDKCEGVGPLFDWKNCGSSDQFYFWGKIYQASTDQDVELSEAKFIIKSAEYQLGVLESEPRTWLVNPQGEMISEYDYKLPLRITAEFKASQCSSKSLMTIGFGNSAEDLFTSVVLDTADTATFNKWKAYTKGKVETSGKMWSAEEFWTSVRIEIGADGVVTSYIRGMGVLTADIYNFQNSGKIVVKAGGGCSMQVRNLRVAGSLLCSVGEGDGCAKCESIIARTKNHECSACNLGHELDLGTKKCLKCPVGTYRPNGDPLCIPCPYRTFAFQEGTELCTDCADCPDGYFESGGCNKIEDTHCEKYNCEETKSGAGCLTCAKQELRLKHDHCTGCNTGYYLKDNSCEMCSSCKPGQYIVTNAGGCSGSEDTICENYTCEETSGGAGCKDCMTSSKLEADNQCRTCHKGYKLDDDTKKCDMINLHDVLHKFEFNQDSLVDNTNPQTFSINKRDGNGELEWTESDKFYYYAASVDLSEVELSTDDKEKIGNPQLTKLGKFATIQFSIAKASRLAMQIVGDDDHDFSFIVMDGPDCILDNFQTCDSDNIYCDKIKNLIDLNYFQNDDAVTKCIGILTNIDEDDVSSKLQVEVYYRTNIEFVTPKPECIPPKVWGTTRDTSRTYRCPQYKKDERQAFCSYHSASVPASLFPGETSTTPIWAPAENFCKTCKKCEINQAGVQWTVKKIKSNSDGLGRRFLSTSGTECIASFSDDIAELTETMNNFMDDGVVSCSFTEDIVGSTRRGLSDYYEDYANYYDENYYDTENSEEEVEAKEKKLQYVVTFEFNAISAARMQALAKPKTVPTHSSVQIEDVRVTIPFDVEREIEWLLTDYGYTCEEICMKKRMLSAVDEIPQSKEDFEKIMVSHEHDSIKNGFITLEDLKPATNYCDGNFDNHGTFWEAPGFYKDDDGVKCAWRSTYLSPSVDIEEFTAASHENWKRFCPCQKAKENNAN